MQKDAKKNASCIFSRPLCPPSPTFQKQVFQLNVNKGSKGFAGGVWMPTVDLAPVISLVCWSAIAAANGRWPSANVSSSFKKIPWGGSHYLPTLLLTGQTRHRQGGGVNDKGEGMKKETIIRQFIHIH
jgi:hypothetical protein